MTAFSTSSSLFPKASSENRFYFIFTHLQRLFASLFNQLFSNASTEGRFCFSSSIFKGFLTAFSTSSFQKAASERRFCFISCIFKGFLTAFSNCSFPEHFALFVYVLSFLLISIERRAPEDHLHLFSVFSVCAHCSQ